MPERQMAVTLVWVCPSDAFQHSAMDSLTIHWEGQYLAMLFSWQILSLLSIIPGFVPFPRLPAAFPFIDNQQFWLHCCPQIFSVQNIFHKSNLLFSQKIFSFLKFMPQYSLKTKHSYILSFSLEQFQHNIRCIQTYTHLAIYIYMH